MENEASLEVLYHGCSVGRLWQKGEAVFFSYSSSWLSDGFSISPRSLPLNDGVFRADGYHFDGLFGVFADSLPDGWGRRLAIRALAQKGINYERLSPLEKLSYLGSDGLGALEYRPNAFLTQRIESGDIDALAVEAQRFDENGSSDSLDELFACGGSSGGARPKAHILINGEEWIVKFPEKGDPKSIGRMEYEYNLAAKACGIIVPEAKLLPSSLRDGYFASKRFDRSNGERIHTLSLCGFLEAPSFLRNLDYVTLLQSVAYLTSSLSEVMQAYRLAAFNVLAENRDDHSKNFAFLYDESKGRYTMAPAYDLTYTPSIPEHHMTCFGNGRPAEDDLLRLAEKMNIPAHKANEIIQKTKEIVRQRLNQWMD